MKQGRPEKKGPSKDKPRQAGSSNPASKASRNVKSASAGGRSPRRNPSATLGANAGSKTGPKAGPGSKPSSLGGKPASPASKASTGVAPDFRYMVLHKPLDVLCQFTDKEGRPTLADYVSEADIYPVGRLDADSEGLLLLTDDGPLQFRLAHPRFRQPKTYWVQVEGIPDDEALHMLRAGVEVADYIAKARSVRRLEGEPALPPRARPIRERKAIPTSWIELVLDEGKNREVRRMTAAVGYPTLRLVRVALGPLRLEGLAPGKCRFLSKVERRALLEACGFRSGSADVSS